MALVALTNEQKSQLQDDRRFIKLVKWTMLDKAKYWVQLDGTSVPGNDYIKWAKSRIYSNGLLNSFSNNSLFEYAQLFCVFLSQAVYEDTETFNVDTVIDYMNDNQVFGLVGDLIFDLKIKDISF